MNTRVIWSSFVAVMRKEFIHVRRDRATLMLALSIPLFQLILFGFLDQTVHHVPTVVVDQDRLFAGCGADTWLELVEVQLEGKKRMRAAEFLRGHASQLGDRLGE